MKGIAIDIETSGLDVRRHNILQIGLVYFDLINRDEDADLPIRKELELWPHISDGILWDPDTYKFHQANAGVDYFMRDDVERSSGHVIGAKIRNFISEFYAHDEKPIVLGKNFGKFDWQFLMRITNTGIDGLFHHSFLDIGNLAFIPGVDKKIPNMKEVLERYEVTQHSGHTALSDCNAMVDVLQKIYQEEA